MRRTTRVPVNGRQSELPLGMGWPRGREGADMSAIVRDWEGFLFEADGEDRPERAVRAAFVDHASRLLGDAGFLLYGGIISAQAFQEACWCFVDGRWLACIAIAHSLVERELHGFFFASGRNDLDRATYAQLLREGQHAGLLRNHEYTLLDSQRTSIRNPYLHPRKHASVNLARRAAVEDSGFEDVYRADGTATIELLFQVLQHRPWGGWS